MRRKALLYLFSALIVLISVIASGCTSPASPTSIATPESSPATGTISSPEPGSSTDTGITEISDLAAVDMALESGPALVEFGAPWCGWCDLEKPVLEQLSSEYPGIAFYSVNIDESPGLANAFYAKSIPVMALIVKKNSDGSYLYVTPAGKTSDDRYKSMIKGYRTYDQLKPLMDAALAAR